MPDLVMKVIVEGKQVGVQGRAPGRPVYEVEFGGTMRRVALTTGSNGFTSPPEPLDMRRRIRILAEYGCHPLWDVSEAPPRNLSAAELGLGGELDRRFAAWAARFEATLDQDYPPASGFASQADLDAFEEEGRRLQRALADALGAPVAYESTAGLRGK